MKFKNMKKAVSITSALLLTTALIGCSEGDKPSEKDAAEEKQTVQEVDNDDAKSGKDKNEEKAENKDEPAEESSVKDEKSDKKENAEAEEKNSAESSGEKNSSGEQSSEGAGNSQDSSEAEKAEIASTIASGKQVIYSLLTSRDNNKIYEDEGRAGVIAQYNSLDSMRAALAPYYTDNFINNFLNNILQAREENGEVTILLGDVGMWPEFSQVSVDSIVKNSADSVTVNYSVPGNGVAYSAELVKSGGGWKINYENLGY